MTPLAQCAGKAFAKDIKLVMQKNVGLKPIH